ncbi:hypothetical protein HDU78_011493 [Chytriomyces hyalinus]|nr:hypothetical protein HDU78_011493 [Chytriomyces hyalinus]
MSIGCAGFALLDPLSPVFTSLTVVSLSLSLWRVRFRPNRSIAATTALSLFLLYLPSLVDKYNKSNLSHLESTTPKCTVSITWNIHGLKCLGCAARLKSHLDALDSIEAATVDFSQNEVSVRAPLTARDRTEEEASTLTKKVSDAVASIDFSYILTYVDKQIVAKIGSNPPSLPTTRMQETDPLSSSTEQNPSRDTISVRSKPRAYAIPLLAVVFVQTLFVAALVLLIPLMISFSAMAASNEQSTATGRRVAQSLAVQVQSAEASLALDRIKSFIKSVNEQTTHVYKSISVHGNQSNLDSLLNAFANEVKYTGYPLIMYYGRQDDAFIQMEGKAVGLTIPTSYRNPDCVICNALRRNFTKEQNDWADHVAMAAGDAKWDETSWAAASFVASNSVYHCIQRPWYIQAASLTPETARIQYTEPYIYEESGPYSLAGITVNIPFFDSQGRVTGVYGSDISFKHMHDILTDFLQSNNSFMYVMTSTGQLVGSSSNESFVGDDGNLIHANQSMSKFTRSTADFLWKLDLDANVKNFTLLDGFQAELDNVTFQVRALLEPPYFVIVNGALKEDYSATISSLRSELTAIERECLYVLMEASAISFAVVVTLGILFNYLTVVRPLRQITSVMVHAARLDFTASANLGQSFRTFIKELTEMEKEFFAMVVNFANSVQESQGLLRVGAKNAFIYHSAELSDAVKVPLLREGRKKWWSLSIAFLALLQTLLGTYPFFDHRNTLEGVFGLDLSFADIHDTLQNYLQTPNAFIYVTSTEGILVGTSSSDTMVDAEGNLILAKDSKTRSTQITGQYLWNANRLEPGYLQSLHGQMLESGGFSFQVRTMDNAPYFVIVNGAPKSDYTGDIDLVLSDLESALANNMKVVVGISMAVFVVAVATSCALTYYSITVPLSKITSVLRDATNFDFTAYKRLQKQNYNYIRELGTMEHVFYLMIAKFAASIRSQDTLKSASITASVKKGLGSHVEQRVTSRLEMLNSMRK